MKPQDRNDQLLRRRLNKTKRPNRILVLFLLLGLIPACAAPLQPRPPTTVAPSAPSPTLDATATIRIIKKTPRPARPATKTVLPSAIPVEIVPTIDLPGCAAANPVIEQILQQTSASNWLEWVKKLSGAEPVTVNGQEVTFTTRYTPAMFSASGPNALDFIHETVAGWYPEAQIEIQPFTATVNEQIIKGKNLILTIPGATREKEEVILSAHLDSTAQGSPQQVAPGAEDNASGSAALLEAARLIRDHKFERTIRIIWFTGEEQGMLGSKAYVEAVENPRSIQAVVNLDMFGYDSDNDRCFEMHVGSLPQSGQIGQCFLRAIDDYDLGLPNPDYLTSSATSLSDHGSFWTVNVGAIEILENMFNQGLENGCSNADRNSYYHTPQDTYDRLNPDSAIRIVRASLATLMALAGPIQ